MRILILNPPHPAIGSRIPREQLPLVEMSIIESLRTKFEALMPYMDEKLRRLWAASEAATLGKGGVRTVSFATGLSPKTILMWNKRATNPLDTLVSNH